MAADATAAEARRIPIFVVRRDGRDAVFAKPESQGWVKAGDLDVIHFVLCRESMEQGLALVTLQLTGTAIHLLRESPIARARGFEGARDLIGECALGDFLDAFAEVPVPWAQHRKMSSGGGTT
jgi:hypothetical protein